MNDDIDAPESDTDAGVAALLAAAEGALLYSAHARLTREDVAEWLRGRAEEWPTHPWNPESTSYVV